MRRRFAIYGSGAGGADVSFQTQTVSVEMDGSSEGMGTATETDIGIANAYTIAIWFKPYAGAFTRTGRMVNFRPGIGDNNIQMQMHGTDANDPIRISQSKSGGGTLKDYEWESLAVQDVWNMVVFSWDGTDLVLYHDGTLTVETTRNTDNTGTQTDDGDRGAWVGMNSSGSVRFEGLIHSVGVWDVVLTSGEQAALYNSGDGNAVDWASDGGGYSSSANLQHWWRLGHDSGDIGKDSGIAAVLKDLMDDADNISAADIVSDAP